MQNLSTIQKFVREYNEEYKTNLLNLDKNFTIEQYAETITIVLLTKSNEIERLITYMLSNDILVDRYLSVFITDPKLFDQIDQIVFEENYVKDLARLSKESLENFKINKVHIRKAGIFLKNELNKLYQKELHDIIVFYTTYKESAFLLEDINTFIDTPLFF